MEAIAVGQEDIVRDESPLETFREKLRREDIRPGYSGYLHLGLVSVTSVIGVLVSIFFALDAMLLEWLVVPVSFIFANAAEYWTHRFPMHRKVPGMGIMVERHAGMHHRFFTHENMRIASQRDLAAVLFPAHMLVYFIGGMAIPMSLFLGWLISTNVGWLFFGTALAYFITYEWLHLAYHLNPDGKIGRLPFMATLRNHHTVHHNLQKMRDWNFNITFPIFDRIFRTSHP